MAKPQIIRVEHYKVHFSAKNVWAELDLDSADVMLVLGAKKAKVYLGNVPIPFTIKRRDFKDFKIWVS